MKTERAVKQLSKEEFLPHLVNVFRYLSVDKDSREHIIWAILDTWNEEVLSSEWLTFDDVQFTYFRTLLAEQKAQEAYEKALLVNAEKRQRYLYPSAE